MTGLKFHHQLPLLGRPFRQRDEARAERDELRLQLAQARNEHNTSVHKRNEQIVNVDEGERQDRGRTSRQAVQTSLFSRVDQITNAFATGWVFSLDKPITKVVAKRDGVIVATVTKFDFRPDVGIAFSDAPGAERSGFRLFYPPSEGPRPSRLSVYADHNDALILIGENLAVDARTLEKTLADLPFESKSPYPVAVCKAIRALYGSDDIAIDDVCRAFRVHDLFSVAQISDYIRFMASCDSHFKFVARAFPSYNPIAKPDDKDYLCRANTAEELISIANHLYVLKSYGLQGAFAEFGCFKGFSSSMLSYACSLLNIPMHIYDSFEGLPSSSSSYYSKGDFKGDFDEVYNNIEQFGAINSVQFHKGFFSESLAAEPTPPLIGLWMDVDLDSSARDAIVAAKMLSPLSAIFSHECSAADFENYRPRVRDGGPNDVLPAILSYYAALDIVPVGQYLAGNTGAFWRSDEGIPVLPNSDLRRLLELIA